MRTTDEFPFKWLIAGLLLAAIAFLPLPAAGPAPAVQLDLDLGGGVALELISIPPGEFQMGETDWSRELIGLFAPHDLRARTVKVSRGFLLGKYEVTVAQFGRFVAATGHQTDAESGRLSPPGCDTLIDGRWKRHEAGSWKDPGFAQTDRHPVTCISWNDAAAFCAWLSRQSGRVVRLPTEVELEYSQRALVPTRYYWGKRPADDTRDPRFPIGYWANVVDSSADAVSDADLYLSGTEMRSLNPGDRDDGFQFTAPVGRFYPNPFGLFDAIGNAWEYTGDWAGEDPRGSDPRGKDTASQRSMRGGSWLSSPDAYRPSYRPEIALESRTSTRGMRVLVEP